MRSSGSAGRTIWSAAVVAAVSLLACAAGTAGAATSPASGLSQKASEQRPPSGAAVELQPARRVIPNLSRTLTVRTVPPVPKVTFRFLDRTFVTGAGGVATLSITVDERNQLAEDRASVLSVATPTVAPRQHAPSELRGLVRQRNLPMEPDRPDRRDRDGDVQDRSARVVPLHRPAWRAGLDEPRPALRDPLQHRRVAPVRSGHRAMAQLDGSRPRARWPGQPQALVFGGGHTGATVQPGERRSAALHPRGPLRGHASRCSSSE